MDLEFEICDLRLEILKAHIWLIWALLIICGSVVVIFAVSILQGKCMAGIAKRLVIGDQLSVIRDDSAASAVDLGGVS